VVSWTGHEWYRLVGWKDDSFVSGWVPRKSGTFTELTVTVSNSNILTITGNFQEAVRDYYWIQKPVNISTDLYRYVLVKWRSTSTCAIAWAYYTDGSSEPIVNYASYSDDWKTTILKLTEGKTIDYLMVGLDDHPVSRYDVYGTHSAYFDFIMLANRTYTKR